MRYKAMPIVIWTCLLVSVAGALDAAASKGKQKPPPVELSSPMRLDRASNGNILVSDHRNRRIWELNKRDLTTVRSFSVIGKPLAVAGGGANIYVGNESSRRVEVYSKSGELLFNLGGANSYFKQPTDIAIDHTLNHVYVVDGLSGIVKVFSVGSDPNGTLIRTLPTGGPDPNVLTHPTGIAVDPTRQEVLISDYGAPEIGIHPRVQIFNYAGNHIGTFSGKAGMFGNRFSRPQGLAVDGKNHVFLVDCWIGRVIVLDRLTGGQIKTLGTYGTGVGELALPLDVVIDPKTKNVFVTNNRPGRIEVFKRGGMVP